MSSAGGRAAKHVGIDRDRDSDMSRPSTLRDHGSSAGDGGNHEADEERMQAQKNMQMLDLGTDRREYVTAHDKPVPSELRLSKQQLLRARKVEEEGTDAAKWYQENKTALNAWNNIGTEIANDNADREQLADLMGGQSHRARLNKEIKAQGGQNYGESSTVEINDYPRHGRGGGVGGRGTPGRSGRGAPMHMPTTSISRSVSTVDTSSVPTGPKANRPLDPAIDPNREYGYKYKRGGSTVTMSYGGGAAVRGSQATGRGSTPKHARAKRDGSTGRRGSAVRRARPEQSEAPQARRLAPVTVALNDQAFLKVLKAMETKPKFNDHVQQNSKPAPNSKAAALVEQPSKASKRPGTATKKPSSALAKSSETPAEAYRRLEARGSNKSPDGGGKVRLAPTHEFAFPPPFTRSREEDVPGSRISVHTDGVESAITLDSADFATQSSGGARAKLDANHGSIVFDPNSTKNVLATAPKADGVGVGVLPPGSDLRSKHRDDLIVLEECSEQSHTVPKASHDVAQAKSHASSMPSSGIPDIMDEELDVDILQSSLTPKPSVAPPCITYRGARYIRADQIPGQDNGNRLHSICSDKRIDSRNFEVPDRVAVTSGGNIGLRKLQENSGRSILGDHNLPRRSRDITEAPPTLALGASEWAFGNVRPETSVATVRELSLPQFRPAPLRQPYQDGHSLQNVQRGDAEMADECAIPSTRPEIVPASDLVSSNKDTPPTTLVMSTQVPSIQAVASPESTRSSYLGEIPRDTSLATTVPPNRQDESVATSKSPDDARNTHCTLATKTGTFRADSVRQGTSDGTLSDKAPNLAASKWASAGSEVNTSAQSKKNFGDELGQFRFPSASPEDSGATIDPVYESRDGVYRRRNPFGRLAPPSQLPLVEKNNKLPTTVPAQPPDGSLMAERSANIPSASHKALTTGEHMVQTMRPDAKAQPSAFRLSDRASSKSRESVDSKRANGAVEGQVGGSRLPQNSSKAMNNLMASKYATNVFKSSF